jgi:hypothetical protein
MAPTTGAAFKKKAGPGSFVPGPATDPCEVPRDPVIWLRGNCLRRLAGLNAPGGRLNPSRQTGTHAGYFDRRDHFVRFQLGGIIPRGLGETKDERRKFADWGKLGRDALGYRTLSFPVALVAVVAIRPKSAKSGGAKMLKWWRKAKECWRVT